LWSNSRIVRETAIEGLIKSGFTPSAEELDRLHQLISDTIGLMTWNISAKVCLEKNNQNALLEIFRKDMARWRKFFFNLLSVAYDAGSIAKIRENLESETVENGNFALEMIDIVIDESIKPKVMALLDIVPDEVKLKSLYQFYPGEVPSVEKLFEDIINRDYNLVDLWTKACTLRNIPVIRDKQLEESASALLFSPEPVLQEEAVKLMLRSANNQYSSVSSRIPDSTRKKLDGIISGSIEKEELMFEKVLFLSGLFTGIPEDELITLCGYMTFRNESDLSQMNEECLVWPLNGSNDKRPIIYHGDKGIIEEAGNGKCYLLPFSAIEEFGNHYPERSAGILAYIDKNDK
ncbi:MAG TPA: hypothetical protein VHO68_13750, partial [Bacteroidales bacterium]|nr:hypothetical protein [Bacteroidales bacterium]